MVDDAGSRQLVERARKNGVPDCQIVPRSEILKKEPKLNHDVIAGLWCPHAGIVSPYEVGVEKGCLLSGQGAYLQTHSLLSLSPKTQSTTESTSFSPKK